MPDGLAALSTVKTIFFGGAPLSIEAGRKLSTVTKVYPLIGSTEVGWLPTLLPTTNEEWPVSWFEWAPESGVEMQPEGDGLFEMVVTRRADIAPWQEVYHTFPDMKEWRMKDLYQPHPDAPNRWRYVGRKDDVLILANGEKFNPVDFEKRIEAHPSDSPPQL